MSVNHCFLMRPKLRLSFRATFKLSKVPSTLGGFSPLVSHTTIQTQNVQCFGLYQAAPQVVLSAGAIPKRASSLEHGRAPWCTRYTR
jgi:hypothetical protein